MVERSTVRAEGSIRGPTAESARGGALVAVRPSRRVLLGVPKEGLRVVMLPELQRRSYRGGADPALLLLVIGTMAAVSVIGAAVLSPREGLTAALAFAFL